MRIDTSQRLLVESQKVIPLTALNNGSNDFNCLPHSSQPNESNEINFRLISDSRSDDP